MNRKSVYLAVCCALGALALAPASSAFAGGKGKSKSDRAKFVPTNGGGTNRSSFSKSLSTKSMKSLSQLKSGNSSVPSLYSTSAARKSLHSFVPFNGQKSLSDAIQNGNLHSTDPGIGNGTGGGTVKWPGKFTATDSGKIADSIKDHKFFPVQIGQNGGQNGSGDQNPSNDGNKKGKGKKVKDCDHDHGDFPWWPIIVGGSYHGGCHDHGCYPGGCYDGCYNNYNGGCYNTVVTCPSVTNIVVEQPAAAAAAQAVLVPGVDLELLDVRLVDAGDAAKNLGPRYRLTFGNRGTAAAGNFQVMLMASLDGKPQTGAPTALTEIAGLASRQVLTADVRLPLAADLATMSKFIVVVDSAAQIGEPDENDNVAVLDREKIASVDPTTVAVQ